MLTHARAQQQELPQEVPQGRAWQVGHSTAPVRSRAARGAPGQSQPLHWDLPRAVLGLELPCVCCLQGGCTTAGP